MSDAGNNKVEHPFLYKAYTSKLSQKDFIADSLAVEVTLLPSDSRNSINMGARFMSNNFARAAFDWEHKKFGFVKKKEVPPLNGCRDVLFSKENDTILVSSVKEGTRWQKEGLQPGMRVVEINDSDPQLYLNTKDKILRSLEIIHPSQGRSQIFQ